MRLSLWLSQFELIFLYRLSYNAVLRPFQVRILASLFDHLLLLFVMSLWLIIPFVYIFSLQKFRRNILDFFPTVSIHNLSFPVRATVIRIYPKRAIDDVCMRLEIYGCLGKRFFLKFKQSKKRLLQGREREIGQGSHSLYEVVSILRVLSLSLFSRIPWKSIATDCSAQRDKGN